MKLTEGQAEAGFIACVVVVLLGVIFLIVLAFIAGGAWRELQLAQMDREKLLARLRANRVEPPTSNL